MSLSPGWSAAGVSSFVMQFLSADNNSRGRWQVRFGILAGNVKLPGEASKSSQ
jgi:hypothetical protein